MQYGDGRGERGEQLSPRDGETEALNGPRSLSPESSVQGESETPAPTRGVMFVRCSVCKVELPSVPVAVGDDANGKWSDGLCAVHEAAMVREVREGTGEPLDCEECGVQLTLDGQCRKCGVSHTERCSYCGRWGYHREDCAEMADPVGPAAEAEEPDEISDEDGDGFASTHDDTCDCGVCSGDDVDYDPEDRPASDIGRRLSDLRSLVVLLVPHALLAMACGGGR